MNVNVMKNSQAAIDLAAKIGIKVRKRAPELLMVCGVASFVGTIVTACKATTKLEEIKAEAKSTLDEIDDMEKQELEEYTHEDAHKDKGIIKLKTAVKVVKLYAPTIVLGSATMLCFFGSHIILKRRNVALSAVALASDKALKEYRQKVAEKFGEEVEKELRYGLVEKEYEKEVTDDKGKTKKVKEKIKAVDKNGYRGQFDFYFDETCPGWDKNAHYNKRYVLERQDWVNKELKRRYYKFHEPLTVNDVCDQFNIPRMPGGNSAGWWYDPDDQTCKDDIHINFGVFNVHDEDARAFVNGLERCLRVCLEPDTLDVWSYYDEIRN